MKWIISDIHGHYYSLLSLIKKIEDYDNSPEYIFNGDYVDRGIHNKEVISLIIEMKKNGAICLTGNHDDVVNYILNGNTYTNLKEFMCGDPTPGNATRWFVQNGLTPTLKSYGVNLPKGPVEWMSSIFDDVAKEFKEKVPDDHKEFFDSLDMYWSNETHFAIHAFFNPYEILPRDFKFIQRDKYTEMLWGRFKNATIGGIELVQPCVWDKIGVFGHTPVDCYKSVTPIKHDKIRLIDGGSFLKMYLVGYCVDKDDWILQSIEQADCL